MPKAKASHTPGDQHDDYSDIAIMTLAFESENRLWAGIGASRKVTLINSESGENLKSINLGSVDTRPFTSIVDAGRRSVVFRLA